MGALAEQTLALMTLICTDLNRQEASGVRG
jgi:hypothetical protein